MKKILVMNFFPAFMPPRSGGEMRYLYIYRELSKQFDITLLSPTYKGDKETFIEHSETMREYRIPKEEIHDLLHVSIDREQLCDEISALVCLISAGTYNHYHDMYLKLYQDADIIIHDGPFMLKYDMFFGIDNKIRIYNSYNYEYKLMQKMWHGVHAERYLKLIYETERELVRGSDLVCAVSEEERRAFINEYGIKEEKTAIVPNGINAESYAFQRDSLGNDRLKRSVFFIGSAFPPNVEAGRFICDELADKCSNITFYIAGKCSESLICNLPNVKLMGLIDENEKAKLFTECDMAINPMFSGGGSNLKTLEFLSAGIPMISTKVGVRGLGLDRDVHYFAAEKDEFEEKLKKIISDKSCLATVAENGKKYVNSKYTWAAIGDDFCQKIQSIINKEKNGDKMVLAICDYEVDSPVAGGALRVFNLLSGISKKYNVVLLCLNSDGLVNSKWINDKFYYIALPKTREHLEEDHKYNSRHWISVSDIVAGYMIKKNPMFQTVFSMLAKQVDCIILEQPYLVAVTDNVDTDAKIIYDSQNYEYKLKKSLLKEHPDNELLIGWTWKLEKMALERTDITVSCSMEEIGELVQFAGKESLNIDCVPNGVSIPEPRYNYEILSNYLGGVPLITFVGSAHLPNIEAANFIIQALAPSIPNAFFGIVGSVCDGLNKNDLPSNVLLFGRVSDAQKDFILFASRLAINPMSSGAGSNLKLADYFAHRIPVVTTSFGARGYDIKNYEHAIIAELPEFIDYVRGVLDNGYNQERMVRQAFEYVDNNLKWMKLSERYTEIIDRLLAKKLLVVTYRCNKTAKGGAEIFLGNVINEIASRGKYAIDVVTMDIDNIYEKMHYACDYSQDNDTDIFASKLVKCIKFPAEKMDTHIQWVNCKQLLENDAVESISLARRFIKEYKEPILLGGWFFPEQYGDGIFRWSSANAEIFTGSAISLQIEGTVPERKTVEVLSEGTVLCGKKVSGKFSICVNFKSANILKIQTKATEMIDKDARPLGVFVSKIVVENSRGEKTDIALNNDFRDYLKLNNKKDYIDALIQSAKQRDEKYDVLFRQTRGPVSKEIISWLDNNVSNYDVVLGHSTPFNTLSIASEVAKRHKVPCVLLPHYHMEDAFYHWKSYYRAMKEASAVIAAPDISKTMFFDKVCSNSVVLPGGGIHLNEFAQIDTSDFDRVYNSESPFALVLGRKAGGKNYKWIIEAVESLCASQCPVRVVMIGRDEDGFVIETPNVNYMGEQPRNVVLGALKRCKFVVNMSESESFGIVILEAWLAGKTVIVNEACQAFLELVQNGFNGITCSKDKLAERIWLLWNNATLADSLAEEGCKKAYDGYSWNNLSMSVEHLLDDVISKNTTNSEIILED